MTVKVGEELEYADTCALHAGVVQQEWMRTWMDKLMGFAAWAQDLRVQVLPAETTQPVSWSTTRQGWATQDECEATGDRWAPELCRVTRRYRVLSGPRGGCPIL